MTILNIEPALAVDISSSETVSLYENEAPVGWFGFFTSLNQGTNVFYLFSSISARASINSTELSSISIINLSIREVK